MHHNAVYFVYASFCNDKKKTFGHRRRKTLTRFLLFSAISGGQPHSPFKQAAIIIIKIINSTLVRSPRCLSGKSHLSINYSCKLLPVARRLINSRAVTQKQASSDKWAPDLKAARSAKHFHSNL